MSTLVDLAAALLLVAGGIFGLLGSWGLVRFPSTMTRLHTPTMTATLGAGGVLLASLLAFAVRGEVAGHELVIVLFLLMGAPLSALYIARTVIWRGRGAERLPAANGSNWAVLAGERREPGNEAEGLPPEPPVAD